MKIAPLHLFICICILLLLTASCEKLFKTDIKSNLKLLDETDYLPLQLGNYWEISSISPWSIDSLVVMDDKEYFRLIGGSDTTFYRKDLNGNVFTKEGVYDEVLQYRFDVEIGETWAFSHRNGNFIWNAKLESKTDKIELDNYTFRNCYRFYFDIPDMADDEYTILLAPGVGFVEVIYYGGSYNRKYLQKASINNVKIQF